MLGFRALSTSRNVSSRKLSRGAIPEVFVVVSIPLPNVLGAESRIGADVGRLTAGAESAGLVFAADRSSARSQAMQKSVNRMTNRNKVVTRSVQRSR